MRQIQTGTNNGTMAIGTSNGMRLTQTGTNNGIIQIGTKSLFQNGKSQIAAARKRMPNGITNGTMHQIINGITSGAKIGKMALIGMMDQMISPMMMDGEWNEEMEDTRATEEDGIEDGADHHADGAADMVDMAVMDTEVDMEADMAEVATVDPIEEEV